MCMIVTVCVLIFLSYFQTTYQYFFIIAVLSFAVLLLFAPTLLTLYKKE